MRGLFRGRNEAEGSNFSFFFNGALCQFSRWKKPLRRERKTSIGVLPVDKTRVTIPPRIAEQRVC